MIPLTKEEKKIHRKQKVCYICKKGFSTDDGNKKYLKVRNHCHFTGKYRGAAHDVCNLRYKTPKEIPVVFHNGSTYDYHFIIKEVAEGYITFSVPIKKELDNGRSVTYKIKFIDSFRFMSSSLSNLVDNLSEGLHCDKCIDCKSYLDYMSVKDDQLIFLCFECKKDYKKDFSKELIKRFANLYEFCNKDINKSIFLLKKGVYPYEYMDSWERFDETSLLDKEAFYSRLNKEDITDVDHRHAKRVFEKFNNKNLGDYDDLHVQHDTLLLADVFENFRNKCSEIYELAPAHFLSAPRLAWQACLKTTEVMLELLTKNSMLLMFEKEIRGVCHVKHRYAKANNKYMKNGDKNKESSYIQYLDANNLYGWVMSQKLPVDGFKWKKYILKFIEGFIRNYDEDSDKGYISEVDVEYSKNLHDLHTDLPFLPERMKINKCNKLV